jgi:hypothetical protein
VLKLADMGEARQVSAPPKRDVPPIPARNWAPPEVRNCELLRFVSSACGRHYWYQCHVVTFLVMLAVLALDFVNGFDIFS